MSSIKFTLAVCTVGGAWEPIAASLKELRPERVIFVVSHDTAGSVEQQVIPHVTEEGATVGPGQYETVVVSDAQDFGACIRKMRDLDAEVNRWLGRGPEYEVAVDFTGGTKCMSAALALAGRRWPCRFVYVGGSERTKGGVGVVVSGRELVVQRQNPWDALGYQAIEDALVLFDQGAYSAASRRLGDALRSATDPEVKSELSAVQQLCDAYDAWDRFDHRKARQTIDTVLRRANDLRRVLGSGADHLLGTIREHQGFLDRVLGEPASLPIIVDLLANALRRAGEDRYDDAVARLYRAMESVAQTRLREVLGIEDTARVPLDKLPQGARKRLGSRAEDGHVWLGLQDGYAVLLELGDEVGQRFHELELDDRERSPLVARNQSILAHGFQPVGREAFEQLRGTALKLALLTKSDLPAFPRLSG